MFLECPLMYKFAYVTKIGRYHYSPNIGDSFGGSLHRALNDFHSSGGHKTQTSEQLSERLRNTWVSTGYSSRKEEREHLDAGMRMLENYYENSKSGAVTVFTERQLREDMGEFVLIGRIDRLDERNDGVLEIIDYKTGRESVTSEEVSNDLAMSIYQLLVKRKHPDKRVIATIHCLRTGNSASAKLTDGELIELEKMIRFVAAEMLKITEDTEISPEWKHLCKGCAFHRICERRAKIQELEWGTDGDR
jgi:RecB family exonuclease